MPPTLLKSRSLLLLPLLLLGALALAACGGDDGPSAAESLADAETIAAAGLLQLADLPDGDWEVEEDTDSGSSSDDDDDSDFLASESCRDLRALAEAFSEGDDNDSLVERERDFQQSGGLEFLQVGSEVGVYEGDLDVSAGRLAAQELLTQSTVLEQCFADAMESSLGGADPDGPSISLTSVELVDAEALLADSVAFGVLISIEISGLPFEFELQMHQIPRGRVLGTLQLIQANSSVLSEALPDIARAFESRLLAAQASD